MLRKIRKGWFGKPWRYRYLRYAMALLLAIISFYLIENYRGTRAWRQHLATRHVEFSSTTIRLEKDRNAACFEDSTFYLSAVAHSDANTTFVDLSDIPDFADKAGTCLDQSGHISQTELHFEKCFPHASPPLSRKKAAKKVFEETDRWATELAAFEQAANMPPASPLLPDDDSVDAYFEMLGQFTPVSQLQKFLQVIRLRAHAHLQLGDADSALHLAISLIRFSDNLATRTTLMDATMAVAASYPLRSLVWEGLNKQFWTEAQLDQLFAELNKIRPLFWTETALQFERLRIQPLVIRYTRGPLERYRVNRELDSLFVIPHKLVFAMPTPTHKAAQSIDSAIVAAMPGGWAQQNHLYLCQHYDYSIQILREENVAMRSKLIVNSKIHDARPERPYNFWVKVHTFGNSAYAEGVLRAESILRPMQIAVAAELHYKRTGNYPKNIEALRQLFTEPPIDPWSGESYRYRLQNDRPLIYSVGENLSDDGGTTDSATSSDDIVWQYPPAAP